ncbi:MAG TPA: ankyrin repeat domain-containing protein [Vicinamibacterales bacterium]|nr:ankyrin repeat domain-containing protein [Vicinamibacterales bacterium]
MNLAERRGLTPLMTAVQALPDLSVDLTRRILAAHPNVDATNRAGMTALYLAATLKKQVAIVRLLLDAGARRDAKWRGKTACDVASGEAKALICASP